MNVETLREFLGWCIVINFGVMVIQFLITLSMRDWVSSFHAKMFRLDETSVRQAYFQYFSNYKVAFIVFNLVPYIALRIMAGN